MCLGIDWNLSNLFGILWSSWICMLISISRFRKFSFIISLNRLFAPCSFSYDTRFHLIPHMFFLFSSHFFWLLQADIKWFSAQVHWFFLPLKQVSFQNPILNLLVHSLYFSSPIFVPISYLNPFYSCLYLYSFVNH